MDARGTGVRRRLLAVAVAGGLAIAGCTTVGSPEAGPGLGSGGDEGEGGGGNGGGLKLIAALSPFDACGDLLTWVKGEASSRVQPWGLNAVGDPETLAPAAEGPVARDATAAQPAPVTTMAATAGSAGSAGAGPAPAATADEPSTSASPSFSSTNVVEEGVDEPDVVKTDGRRLVTISDQTLRVVDLTGAQPVEVGTLDLGPSAWGSQLLVAGDRALVLSQGGGLVWRDGAPTAPAIDSSGTAVIRPTDVPLSAALLREVDLSDPATPRVLASARVEGGIVDARQVGTTARVVVQSSPSKLQFVSPSSPSAQQRALDANREVIDTSTADDWLPSYVAQDANGATTAAGPLVACDRVHHPADFAGFSTTSVLTVDLAGDLDLGDAVAVLADAQQIYASPDNLYVAVNRWGDEQAPSTTSATTAVHKFSITGSEPATYEASGEVPGHLLDAYAMSERDGVLRVATTEQQAWAVPMPASGGVVTDDAPRTAGSGSNSDGSTSSDAPVTTIAPSPSPSPSGPSPSEPVSESFVTTLAQQDATLVQLGQVGGLGRGEQIYAVRFIDDVGYVVTFRRTDPLFTIDLSDPTAPRLRGELELLGYSAYLHPLGEGRLLGIGQSATAEGRVTGAQATLFDVADLDAPRVTAQVELPSGWSDVEQDHHAFLWWSAASLAVLPVQAYGGDDPFSGVLGLRAEGSGLAEAGRISHPSSEHGCGGEIRPVPVPPEAPATTVVDPGGSAGSSTAPALPTLWCPPTTPAISRSLVVGDALYTLSQDGLKASSLTDLTDRSWLPFG